MTAAGRPPVRPVGSVPRCLRRLGFLVAFALAGVLVGRVVVSLLHLSPPDDASPRVPSPPGAAPAVLAASDTAAARTTRRAAAVLHHWDADRAAAYARGDPAALRRFYLPGSAAGVRDVRLLRAYVERGLVVRGLRTQLLSLRVLTERPSRLRLVVTDRLAAGRAVSGRRAVGVTLPSDAPSTRLVELRRRDGRWRMASVEER